MGLLCRAKKLLCTSDLRGLRAEIGLSFDLSLRGILFFTLLPLFPGVKFLLQQLQENLATINQVRSLADHSEARLDALKRSSEPPATARQVRYAKLILFARPAGPAFSIKRNKAAFSAVRDFRRISIMMP